MLRYCKDHAVNAKAQNFHHGTAVHEIMNSNKINAILRHKGLILMGKGIGVGFISAEIVCHTYG